MRTLVIILVLGALTWGIWTGYRKFMAPAEGAFTDYTSNLQRSKQKAEEANASANLAVLKSAISQYHASKQQYPASLQDLVDSGYLDKVPEGNFSYNAETGEVTR